MVDHAARDHAQWSASATERNWNCSGALAITDGLPDKTSEASDWGTCCHQISEKSLRSGDPASEYIGTTEKGKVHSFEVDEEMADTAQTYVDYIQMRRAKYKEETGGNALIFIEEKFSLASLNPPFEAGGTSDCVLIFPLWKLMEVIDLKAGRGVVVEVEGNKQGRTYGLGAMLKHDKVAIERVKVTIVQPRAPHKDGRIRSEEFHVADLVEWTSELVEAMERSAQALADKDKVDANLIPQALWDKVHLKAGDHCKFCKAAGFCPALQQKALDAAHVWFDDLDQPRISNSPDSMSPEVLAQMLDAADMISEWINAVRSHAHEQAEAGIEIPNYVLVAKEGREKWLEGKEAEAAAKAEAAGLAKDKIWNAPKTKTPKQIRDALKKAKLVSVAEELEDFSGSESKGTNLVRATKTTRAAVEPAVNKHFSILD